MLYTQKQKFNEALVCLEEGEKHDPDNEEIQLRVLIFLLLIFGFTIGVVSKRRITKFIAGMIFIPTLVALIWHYIKNFRASMDPTASLPLYNWYFGGGPYLGAQIFPGKRPLAQRGRGFRLWCFEVDILFAFYDTARTARTV